MDVLLARDGDLLRLVFEELNVVVDVEDVFVELGEVVELWGEKEGSLLIGLWNTHRMCSPLVTHRCWLSAQCVHHLLPDCELQALHQLLLFQAMKVLVEVFLPPRGVRNEVIVLVEENHRLLSHTEEYHLLFARQASNDNFFKYRITLRMFYLFKKDDDVIRFDKRHSKLQSKTSQGAWNIEKLTFDPASSQWLLPSKSNWKQSVVIRHAAHE